MRTSEIDHLLISKKESDRLECINSLKAHLCTNTFDTESWYDLACCHDFLGQEFEAELCYRKAYLLGIEVLSNEKQKGFYVGFGSTLRNNKKFDESLEVLKQGIQKFPDYLALRVFLGFTLHSMGRHEEASKELFEMASLLPTSVLDGYERAIGYYAKQL